MTIEPTIALAAGGAPSIVQTAKDGVSEAINKLSANPGLMGLLKFIGGAIILICVVILLVRKFAPSWQFMQGLCQAQHTVMWCVIAIALGLALVAPATVIPFFVALLATPVQWVFNIVDSIVSV